MEKTTQTASKGIETASTTVETAAKQFGKTVADVLDRLEGTQSSIKLSFEDLNIDTGVIRGSVTGAVVLTANYAHEK